MKLSSFQIKCECKVADVVFYYRRHPSIINAALVSIADVGLEIAAHGIAAFEFFGKSVIHLNNKETANSLFFLGLDNFASFVILTCLSPVLIPVLSVFAYFLGEKHTPLFRRAATQLMFLDNKA